MKSFLVTLLIIGAAFLGYDYFIAPPARRVVFARPPVAPQAAPVTSQPSTKEIAPPPPAPAPSPAVATEAPSPQPAPAPAGTKPAPQQPQSRFAPIEMLTNGWTRLPATAFPRPVTLVRDAKFTMGAGSSVVRGGTEVVALSLENAQLLIAPSEASTARTAVALDDTDLKSRLTAAYEQWKIDRIEEARRLAEARARQPKPAPSGAGGLVDATGKPVMAPNGTIPLLLEKLKTGDPSEITPTNVIRWRDAEAQTVNGVTTWAVEVRYKAKTMFGDMDVETVAHVRDGRVVDWVFKGSGEPVP